ncbi:MAG TPA: acetate--CoA ligase family protein [Candidatus Limnocylindrales bacterium]|nr:acetate--CoA ligase family protein [Candidatus Limnocylindrales bacterium]
MSPRGGAVRTAAPGVGATTSVGSAPTIDLRPLFAPRSIAVVGASPKSDTARILRDNIERVGGGTHCHLVNPRYDEIDGSRCYPDLAALPEVPDIAVVAVNPLRATEITRLAAAAGVPAVIIPGGGVIEGGDAAARMQAEVAEIAATAGIALLGPNCMGVIDLHARSATYYDDLPELRSGGTVGIAQSGSVTNAFMNSGTRIGWSRLISCGSEVTLDVCDFMAAALDDPVTDSIVLFVEGFKRPDRFLALADRALASNVPVLAVKVGRSPQAQAAAMSHSGSLAGDARASEAAMRASGIVVCDDLDELLETAALVSRARRLGRTVGRGRTAVVTVSTGEASLVADLAPRTALDLPPIPASAAAAIREAMPTLTHVENPLDPWGAGDYLPTYRATLEALATSGAYDVLALVHDFPFGSPRSETALAVALGSELVAATAATPNVLPVFASLTAGDVTPEVMAALDDGGGIPVLRGAVAGFAAIPRMAAWEVAHQRRAARGPARPGWPALARDVPACAFEPRASTGAPVRELKSEAESLRLLGRAGIPAVVGVELPMSTPGPLGPGQRDRVEALGWPLAVKVDAPGLAHKSDGGGVVLGVGDWQALDAAIATVLRAAPGARGVLVQPMAGPGIELIFGARRDPQFGPFVLVGFGGTLAEVLDDVSIRLAPVDRDMALGMLRDLRAAPILDGVRGRPAVAAEPIAELLVALGQAMLDHPEWLEVDINPVIVGPGRPPIAVDALIVADVRPPDWDFEDPGGRSRA